MNNRLWKNLVAAAFFSASSLGFAPSASASLLTPAYEAQLATWLGQGPLAFTNIYNGSTGNANFNQGEAWRRRWEGCHDYANARSGGHIL